MVAPIRVMSGVLDHHLALADVVSGPVRVEAALLGAPEEEDTVAELAGVLRSIFAMADRGAYVTRAAAPQDASFAVVDDRISEFGVTWECQATATDWRISQIVRNALVTFTQIHQPVSHFSMVSPGPSAIRRTLPPLGRRPVEESYPGLSNALQIPVLKSAPQTFRGGRRVAIEFVDRLSDPALKRTIELLEVWAAASFGAYASNEEDAWSVESAIFDVTPDVMDDWTVEVAIERFGAPEVAWFSLINLSGRFDTDIAPIASVVIE
jgi:hypothetical protein